MPDHIASFPRMLTDSGREVYSGAEGVLKGLLEIEDGVHLVAGCPMAPLGAMFTGIERISETLAERGMVARLTRDPATAVAMVHGAQMAGCRGAALLGAGQLEEVGPAVRTLVRSGSGGEGGAVLVCGDDPTGVVGGDPSDPRRVAEALGLPLLEASRPGEAKAWVGRAFALSAESGLPIGLLLSRSVAAGGASMEARLNQWPIITPEQRRQLEYGRDIEGNLARWVPLTIGSRRARYADRRRLAGLAAAARRAGLNQILHRPAKGQREPLGLVTAGAAHAEAVQAMEQLGVLGKLPVLKLGLVWPVDLGLVKEFVSECERVLVVEERGVFLERHIRAAITQWRSEDDAVETAVSGRMGGGEASADGVVLHPSEVLGRLAELLAGHPGLPAEVVGHRIAVETDRMEAARGVSIENLPRTPTFCAGCPDRDVASVLGELTAELAGTDYMQRTHNRGPVRLVIHGDQGCSSLMRYPPHRALLHSDAASGRGGAVAAGARRFLENRHLVMMGDASFFRSGYGTIADAAASGRDGAFLILDNKVAALSGQHPHAGSDSPLTGGAGGGLSMERMLKGLRDRKSATSIQVVRVDPEARETFRAALETAVLGEGVNVLIADKECGVTRQRRAARERAGVRADAGYLPKQRRITIAADVCEHCFECTRRTGCPGLTIRETDYGPKMQTDATVCVDDGACARLHVCPSFEEVVIHRRQAPPRRCEALRRAPAQAARKPIHAANDEWRAHLSGIGGQGVRMLMRVIAAAGAEMGYHVAYQLDRGRAVRTDTVSAQLLFTHVGRAEATSATIPHGRADVVLGADLRETARAIDARAGRCVAGEATTGLISTSVHPTMAELTGASGDDRAAVAESVRGAMGGGCRLVDADAISEHIFGTARPSNLLLLGMAYQDGLIPVELAALERAIRQALRREYAASIEAFNVGRHLAAGRSVRLPGTGSLGYAPRRVLRQRAWLLRRRLGEMAARQYRVRVRRTMHALRGVEHPDQVNRTLAIRAYDCVLWGGVEYLQRYLKRVRKIRHMDRADRGFELTAVVIEMLARVMLIKDEPYVAELLTRPEKLRADRRRYQINRQRGDRIEYRHFHRPEFSIFGRRWRFRWRSSLWQLRLMARAGFLRDLLPGWHRREREYREWYEQLVDQVDARELRDDGLYDRWLDVLSSPAEVRGFREVVYPKMRAAQTRVDTLLNQSVVVDASVLGEEAEGEEDGDEAAG